MKRIFFLNRYFYPDHSATSQILYDLAFYLAASRRQVHVITSQQRYDDPDARLPSDEIIDGVRVGRVSTTQFGRSALTGRAVDYVSFYASAWRRLRKMLIHTLKCADCGYEKTRVISLRSVAPAA
jgi:colanic acid biosynthesis glycosyl transferase WcaI